MQEGRNWVCSHQSAFSSIIPPPPTPPPHPRQPGAAATLKTPILQVRRRLLRRQTGPGLAAWRGRALLGGKLGCCRCDGSRGTLRLCPSPQRLTWPGLLQESSGLSNPPHTGILLPPMRLLHCSCPLASFFLSFQKLCPGGPRAVRVKGVIYELSCSP